MKRTVYTNADTIEVSRKLLRVWERSWRLRGWVTKILSPGETAERGSLVVPYWWINFSYHNPPKRPAAIRSFGDAEWITADVVKFRADTTEQQILECGRSLA